MKKYLWASKPIIQTLLFILALSFEEASSERQATLILIFTLYIAWGFVRPRLHRRNPWLMMVDGLLILALEYYSKYLINYFFHSLYIAAILEAGITLDRKHANIQGVLLSLLSLYKFGYALVILPNAKTIAEFLFNLFSLAFLITLTNYGRLQSEERQNNDMLYQELLKAYQKLKEYSLRVEEASVIRERSRIAGEIHDGLGHRLTSLIMQMEMLDQRHQRGEAIHPLLQEVKERAREALGETRRAVGALKDISTVSIQDVKALIQSFSRDTGVEVDGQIPDVSLGSQESMVLFRLVQESMTNALRHGRCTHIRIGMEVQGEELFFEILDNGVGGIQKDGFGQQNMRKRVEDLGGRLEISPGKPYGIKGAIPIHKKKGGKSDDSSRDR